MTGDRLQAEALGQGGQDERPLGQREGVADAHARPAAEGEVGELRPARPGPGKEAFRLEALRLVPQLRVAVGDVGWKSRTSAFAGTWRPSISSSWIVTRGSPGAGGIEAQRLLEDGPRQRQVRQVVEVRLATAQPAPRLVGQRFLHVGMLPEQVPRPGERRADGFVAGASSVSTSSRSCWSVIPVPDSSSRAASSRSSKSPGPGPWRRRPSMTSSTTRSINSLAWRTARLLPVGNHSGGVNWLFIRRLTWAKHDAEGPAQRVGVAADVVAEQRRAGDAQGEAHHLVYHVDDTARLAARPLIDEGDGGRQPSAR